MSDSRMLLVAGYADVDLAEKEFRALAARVSAKELHSDGMILVGKNADGSPMVMDTGNHMVAEARAGAVASGCSSACSHRRCSRAVAVGAAAGAVVGRFAGQKLTSTIQDQVGAALKDGTAVIIGVFPADERLPVEQALAGAALKSVVESDEGGIDELKVALAEAMGKFNPDRTVLLLRDKPFGGVAGRTRTARFRTGASWPARRRQTARRTC